MVGAWRAIEDRDVERLVKEIYTQREHDLGRPVELEA